MRKSTFLWLTLAAVASATLFHTSQEVTDGRARLAQINKETQQEEESLRVLQAEWSYLNQPERLEKLVRQFMTGLEPQKGRQFMRLSELKDRLIEPAAPAEAVKSVAEAPSIAADEAPHADAAAIASNDEAGSEGETGASVAIEEVTPAAEAVAVNAAEEAASKPESTFSTEYRAAGPRKAEENVESAPEAIVEKQEAAASQEETVAEPEAPVVAVAPEPVAKSVAKAPVKAAAPKAPAKSATTKPTPSKSAPSKAAPVKSAPAASAQSKRGFNDVIKGLGVQKP